MIDDLQVAELVSNPSLGSVTYQARLLVEELTRISDEEYPSEARAIRDVFLCLAEHLASELWQLHSPAAPFSATTDPSFWRTRRLAAVVQELHSYLRYLKASSPGQTPPGIQVALTQLTQLHFPQQNGPPVCLVRPQWKYNLACVLITWQLRNLISSSVLDPLGKLAAPEPDDIVPVLWKQKLDRLKQEERDKLSVSPPKQLAVLSFAGLDTHDSLLYPLLAHELGHFLDYSYNPQLSLQQPLAKHLLITVDDVLSILNQYSRTATREEAELRTKALRLRVSVCLRELLADLIATRMMGLSFFVAQAEFLKTIAPWPQAMVTPSGYPGIRFRLSVALHHLIAETGPDNILSFLDSSRADQPTRATLLLGFVQKWQQRLPDPGEPPPAEPNPSLQRKLEELAETAVTSAVKDLNDVAAMVIPDTKCARLTTRFFDRITMLEHDLPPSLQNETRDCYAEIMSSAWAYQIITGKLREIQKPDLEGQVTEYVKTCRLVLKATEVMEVAQTPGDLGVPALAQPTTNVSDAPHGGVLGATALEHRMVRLSLGHKSHIAVVPRNISAIKAASLDVRLGNWFAIARRTRLQSVNVNNQADRQLFMRIGREEFFVRQHEGFFIHPGDLVLGTTLEFFGFPNDTMAFVEGKSSLGRMGLFVATATQIAPGFHGVIVLELVNAGTVPLKLEPHMDIAQLVFHSLPHPVPEDKLYRGPFYCQIKPVLTHSLL